MEFFCKITRKILKLIYDKIYKKYGDIPHFPEYLADKALKSLKLMQKKSSKIVVLSHLPVRVKSVALGKRLSSSNKARSPIGFYENKLKVRRKQTTKMTFRALALRRHLPIRLRR